MNEMTPLLRFVYATFAMRSGWEGRNHVKCWAGDLKREPSVCDGGSSERQHVEAFARPMSPYPASPLGVDETQSSVGELMALLEGSLSAQTDEAAAEVVAHACKVASDADGLRDLVAALVSTLLDMDDETSEERQQGLSEVLLRMCFERSSTAHDTGGNDIVATPYCDTVVDHLNETMRDLDEIVGADEVCSHTGGRLIDRTLNLIVDNLAVLRTEYKSMVV